MNSSDNESLAEMLPLSVELAARHHGTTMNKDGTPYLTHPLRMLAEAQRLGYGYAEQIAAVLHDTIEDTELTLDDLRRSGFPESMIHSIDCLTKTEEEKADVENGYARFVKRAASDPVAARVKLLDLYDNIDVTRLPELGDWELKRTAKYHRAINYLRGHLGMNPLGA